MMSSAVPGHGRDDAGSQETMQKSNRHEKMKVLREIDIQDEECKAGEKPGLVVR